jgi:hypothetical protein
LSVQHFPEGATFCSEERATSLSTDFRRFLQRDVKVLTEDMNLGQQIVNLALAKKVKELGVKQESYFAWYEERYEGDVQIELAG